MMKKIQSIHSPANPRVKAWMKLKNKKGRQEQQQLLIEGEHLLQEAIKAGLHIVEVIIDERKLLLQEDYASIEAPWFELSTSLFHKVVDTESPQGVAAVVAMPQYTWEQMLPKASDQATTYLLLDAIQDPGNLGTIFRTAEAANVTGIVLGRGCVDPFNAKVVRSAMGSLFRVLFVERDLGEMIPRLQQDRVRMVGTSLQSKQHHFDYSFPPHVAILLGNEGQGVDEMWLEKADETVKIPLFGEVESLNVSISCGILLYERVRQAMI